MGYLVLMAEEGVPGSRSDELRSWRVELGIGNPTTFSW